MPKSGYMIFNTWFCTAWPAAWPAAWSAACRALCEAFRTIPTKGGRRSRPPLYIFYRSASHNGLHAADHAAGHAAGHAVQNHILKIMYPDLGMPKPCI